MKHKSDAVVRYNEGRPIVTHDDFSYDVVHVLNPAAYKLSENNYVLLCRVTDRKEISHLALGRSTDGIRFSFADEPTVSPDEFHEMHGVEDPRITKIDDTFYIPYTAYSSHGPAVGLFETTDFETYNRKGIILPPDNKDVVILPKKVNGNYFMYHRPMSEFASTPEIWSSTSPDLVHWGNHQFVMSPKDGPVWSSERIGMGSVPIETKEGWLSIYHGASIHNVYSLGLALFDLDDPSTLIRRSESWILSPDNDYERNGWVNNVVFTCGSIVEPDNEVKIYYGAGDSRISLATASLDDLVSIALNH